MTTITTTSKRSGGPQTLDGKIASSKNAMKSGAYSSLVVLPGENESHFNDLEQRLFDDFKVQGFVESALAHDLAVFTWKRMRLERLEKEHLIGKLDKSISSKELSDAGLSPPEHADHFLKEIEDYSVSDIEAFRTNIDLIEGWLKPLPNLDQLISIKESYPDLYEWIVQEAEELGLMDPTPQSLLKQSVTQWGATEPLIERVLNDIKSWCESAVWVSDHQEDIESAKDRIRDQRLLGLMQADGNRRAFDDLARGFYRTLQELRKQQEWRRRHEFIELNPQEARGQEPEVSKS